MKGFFIGVGATAGLVAGLAAWFWYWLYRNQP